MKREFYRSHFFGQNSSVSPSLCPEEEDCEWGSCLLTLSLEKRNSPWEMFGASVDIQAQALGLRKKLQTPPEMRQMVACPRDGLWPSERGSAWGHRKGILPRGCLGCWRELGSKRQWLNDWGRIWGVLGSEHPVWRDLVWVERVILEKPSFGWTH